ncbi:CAAX protease [Vibrio sp. UCD-FRSSP16_10]|uniref:CPBP family intramembrane glutamic endopeptidase n=1 Tax=unclassified Vibrio TaxID=2614977 RepID=UPI0007FF09EC|nr:MULTISPECIES: CPBP family intramembrane glutamic endopeptidase [unclassified Vibrio]OBT16310.1 CAAX protease [Vibrio sp. UCD-FRSSP16_30]OBT21175.1 CAAX protease [Vibrio sp. UCD-FRSSP16_10]
MLLSSDFWIWVPLAVAMACALFGYSKAGFIGLAIAVIGAYLESRLSILAIGTIIFGLAMAWQIPQLSGWRKYSAWVVVIAWCAGLALHLLPGFDNLHVLDNVRTGPNSITFNLYLNLDKPIIFFALLLAYPQLLGQNKTLNPRAIITSLLFLSTLLPIAVMMGKIGIEVTIPAWWWLFALNNLLLTCVVEEAIFRGLIQQSLTSKFDWKIALAVASGLFGFAHIAGGLAFVIFATLAGVGYGMMFHLSGRLWIAVLTHFLFNFCHLLFFTYPISVIR